MTTDSPLPLPHYTPPKTELMCDGTRRPLPRSAAGARNTVMSESEYSAASLMRGERDREGWRKEASDTRNPQTTHTHCRKT